MFINDLRNSDDNWLKDENLFRSMEQYANQIGSREKRNQVRKAFNQFITVLRTAQRSNIKYRLRILDTRLLYSKARETIGNDLYSAYHEIIKKISNTIPDDDEKFKRWSDDVRRFVEAFYAYLYVNARK